MAEPPKCLDQRMISETTSTVKVPSTGREMDDPHSRFTMNAGAGSRRARNINIGFLKCVYSNSNRVSLRKANGAFPQR